MVTRSVAEKIKGVEGLHTISALTHPEKFRPDVHSYYLSHSDSVGFAWLGIGPGLRCKGAPHQKKLARRTARTIPEIAA